MQTFKSSKGMGLIEILVAVVVIAVLAVAGYMVAQGMNDAPAQQNDAMEHSDASDHDHHDAMEMATYHNETYGFSFDYPKSWEVEVIEGENPSEPFVSLVNADGERRLSFFDDAAMGCEETPTGDEEETTLTIGDSVVKIAKNCNQGWGFLTAEPETDGAAITLTPGEFIGTDDEDDVRHVLETVEGLSNIAPVMK